MLEELVIPEKQGAKYTVQQLIGNSILANNLVPNLDGGNPKT
jgi:hypothetical protein